MTPSSTEIVAALGAVNELVGVDEFSEEPASVKALPKVGTFLDPSLEAVIALEPDVVVLDRVQSKAAGPLKQAGIDTVILEMHTIADLIGGLRQVGAAIGRADQAAALASELEAAVDGHRARADRRPEPRPIALAVVDRAVGQLKGVVVAGPGSFIDELLAVLGVQNAMAASGVRYANIGAEQILRARPTVILDAVHAADNSRALGDWDRLPDIPAVESGNVHLLNDRMFTSPSPRVPQALERLEQLIYGIRAE